MKRIFKFFKMGITVCLLSVQGAALAQADPFSQIVRYNGINGTEVITRALPNSCQLTCIKSVNGDKTHTFVSYRPSTGDTRRITCNLGALFSAAADDYHIKDMYIFDNKCYFCGYYAPSEIEPIYDPFGNITDATTYGIVGYFDLFAPPLLPGWTRPDTTISNPFLDSIYLITIPETDSIMQIVAHHDDVLSYDMFLMAVGYTSRYPLSTCVVELTKPVGTADTYWSLNIVQPTCAKTEEYMTDIVLTEDHVVVASKLPYADGGIDGDTDPTHYLFRLHEAKRDGFYNTTVLPSSSASVWQYDVSAYGVGIGCHHIGDPIRLCPLDGNRFCVYYNGERRENPMYYGIGSSVLFWMNEARLMEHAARTYLGSHCNAKEAVWLGDSYKTIALLRTDTRNYPEGNVIFPTLYPAPLTYCACLAQRIQGVNLHSIDCNPATQYLYIGGTYPGGKLCLGLQDEIHYCDYAPTCLTYDNNYFSLMSPQETTGEYCTWSVELEDEEKPAQKANLESISCYKETICAQEINQ
ncbi:MAG: hypothetical protein J5641_02895 [Bacteroidales bacterium]|nr:hypothetical protein [Bacteroidales bacterium]